MSPVAQLVAAIGLVIDLTEKLGDLAEQLDDGASEEELDALEARMARAVEGFRARRRGAGDPRE